MTLNENESATTTAVGDLNGQISNEYRMNFDEEIISTKHFPRGQSDSEFDAPVGHQSDEILQNHSSSSGSLQELVPCHLCGRKFLQNRLEKHLIICKKIKEKKRQLFDAAKQRAENLDKINHCDVDPSLTKQIAQPKRKINEQNNNDRSTNKSKEPPPPSSSSSSKKQSNWRQQHQEFIRTIRAARGAPIIDEDDDDNNNYNRDYDGNGKDGDRNKTKPLPSNVIECPTCNRRFSIKAADRHLKWCAENQQKQKDRQQNDLKNQEALERMRARTKYKPMLQSNSKESKTTSSSMKRSRSISTLDTNSIKTDPNIAETKAVRNKASTTTTSNNKNNNLHKKISKSSENLTTKLAGANHQPRNVSIVSKSRPIQDRSPCRQQQRTINSDRNKSRANQRTNDSENVVHYTTNNNSHHRNVASKIDTGLNLDRSSSHNKQRQTERSAPVMKFKEKFPNHLQRENVRSIIDQYQDIEHILRRNSTAIYDDSPKTVPGVRTGGISPMKNSSSVNNVYVKKRNVLEENRSMKNKFRTNGLQKFGNDIKKRIDQYITRLYDNELWPNGFLGNDRSTMMMATNTANKISMIKSGQFRHSSSAQSDDARMSTSDSTDSGLGVIFNGGNGNQSIVERATDRTMVRGKSLERNGSKHSSRTFRADVISPTMSDIETNNRLLLRNGSLNDIELFDRSEPIEIGLMMNNANLGNEFGIGKSNEMTETKPRFCHQCGTKYPNILAKFCYECGSKRSESIV
ncbi:hypothetical protein NH340_JMT07026 [Sarcoptes scabiei]|nr:hypothetical protein NH340_JMT07026 [Sarcoptes scabiei]